MRKANPYHTRHANPFVKRAGTWLPRRAPWRRHSRPPFILWLAGFLIVGAVASLVLDGPVSRALSPHPMSPFAPGTTISQHFEVCAGRGGSCLIDGDTIRIDGQSVRIADIDTPEVRGYQCDRERELGNRATERMRELVNQGPFQLAMWDHRDEDVYGRKLRVLERDGQSLGMILVDEGLARVWGGAREPWC